ncbi:MAG TPA: hypothetical protein VK864_11350 [Longimicrobiales bacterium]|nr:hypothetical protein [Longimicrobiales bacterium]
MCLILASCSDPVCPGPFVRDSAGVQIIEHSTELVNALELQRWPDANLVLGEAEGEPELEFSGIRSIAALADGRIVVADGASNELRTFTSDGSHQRSSGGLGSGPGEFRLLLWARAMTGDSILAYDGALDRFTVLAADGRIIRVHRAAPVSDLPYAPVATFRDGSVLGVTARPLGGISGDGILIDSSTLFVHDAAGAFRDSVGHAFFMERWARSSGIYNLVLRVPYGRTGLFAVAGDLVCVGDGGQFEIRCLTPAGALTRVIRVAVPQVAVTPADVDSHFAKMWDRRADAARSTALRRELPFPASFPAFELMAGARNGQLWVVSYRAPRLPERTVFVFDDAGRLVRRFVLRADLQIATIEAGHIYGVLRDELGVERVARYPIHGALTKQLCKPSG